MGFFDPSDEQVTPEAVFAHFHDVTSWYIEDGEVTIDRSLGAQFFIDFVENVDHVCSHDSLLIQRRRTIAMLPCSGKRPANQ